MSEQDRAEEHVPLSGDVEPTGAGEWITLEEAGRRLGIDRKAVYRRIRRGRMLGKKAPFASHLLVWFPTDEEQQEQEQGEPGHSLVPDQQARFLELLNKATASLGQQVQQLTEEREQARQEREQERIRNKILTAERDAERQRAEAAERERDELARRKWWEWWRQC